MSDFWQACTQQLRDELTPQQFAAWIKPLSTGEFRSEDRSLRIGAPNRFKLDWVKNQFATRIEAIAARYFEGPIRLEFFLDAKAADTGSEASVAATRHSASDAQGVPATTSTFGAEPVATKSNGAVPPYERRSSTRTAWNSASPTGAAYGPSFAADATHGGMPGSSERSRLNAELTFDSFVTGKANQLARAAATQVADHPGTSYNPLFLHGGVGLGKTHLIQAIGNQLLARLPAAKIRYIHAEQFVGDVVKAYQRKAFESFKHYYHSLDLLLIDDIQFFSGKNRTQEEFFYAFEALIAAKKQIIITSDTYPAEMSGIDDRLVSRFSCGLTVAVEPPELEMRVAILLKKSEQEAQPLSDEVAFFIAKHLRSNVRELEGALRKILAYSSFHGRDITIDLAREALKDLLSVQRAQVSVESIQKTVADFYKIKVADMYSARRPSNIARPRQIAMYFAKELTQKSLPEIGELFGGRDHTTVLHAVRKITELRSKQAELNRELHVLKQTLKG